MGSISAVFFDLFHTLVDVAAAPGASGRYTADILGVGRERWNAACFSDHHALCSPSDQLQVVRTLAHSIDPTIPMARIEQAALERQRRFDHALCHVEDEVLAVLGQLRERGLRLALISNASSGEVSAWPRSPLAGYFDMALFSCACGWKKPQPQIYELALTGLGVRPGQTLFVGDGGSDEHLGARRCGLHSVLLTRYLSAATAARRRIHADSEVASLGGLAALIDG